jgi:hypothetical protein
MRTKRVILCISLALVVFVGSIYGLRRLLSGPTGPIASAQLADGRILQIEGVTFGTRHHIGKRSLVEPIEPWLPRQVVQLFAPQHRHSDITLDEPGLVVWVNAIDPVTRKYVDCQQIRMEFIGEHGDLFGQETSSWSGSPTFWRAGHIFHAFPRTQPTLALQVSCWRSQGSAVRMEFPNPCLTTPASWPARPLPQRLRTGDLEVELTSLVMRTNGGPKQFWQTPGQYWEPVWKLRRDGTEVAGWDKPKWTAADPSGNRGQFLGTRQPVLRFSAEFFPSATNLADAIVLGRLAPMTVAPLQSNAWADVTLTNGSARLTVLGLFPPGTYVFTGGRFETNPVIRMGPTKGGAPSGWVGQSKRISPTQIIHWSGHYTPVPVVYIRAPASGSKDRLGVRLRDEQGRYWLAKPEPQGPADGIWPFLVELPPEVSTVSAEVVVLKPIQAEFTVQTATQAPPLRGVGEPIRGPGL